MINKTITSQIKILCLISDPSNPGPLQQVGRSPTSIEFSWSGSPAPPFDYYEIFYRDPSTGARVSAARVYQNEMQQYRLERLDPSTAYTVELETVLEASGTFVRQSSCQVSTIEITTGQLE